MNQFDFDLTNMGDYRLIPQLVERVNEQIRIEGEKFICERLMDLQIDKDILFNQVQEIRRLNGILQEIKDKQEQGLLHEAKIPNGTEVYMILEDLDEGFYIHSESYIYGATEYHFGELGKDFFLTEAEAEEALARMKGE